MTSTSRKASWGDLPSEAEGATDVSRYTGGPADTARDWRCTTCGNVPSGVPETTLLGGYRRGPCRDCDKMTVWVSAQRKAMLRAT